MNVKMNEIFSMLSVETEDDAIAKISILLENQCLIGAPAGGRLVVAKGLKQGAARQILAELTNILDNRSASD